MTRYSTIILCTIASTAAIVQAALLGLVVTLAAIDLLQTRLHVPSLVAAVFDAVVLLALLLLVSEILIERRQAGRTQNAAFLFLFALSLTALALSIYILSSAWLLLGFRTTSLNRSLTACLIVAGMVLWAVSLVLQVSIYMMLLTAKQPESNVSVVSPKRYSMRALGNSPRRTSVPSPYSPTSSITNSIRHASVSQVFGPLGSKTRLLIANSLHAHDSQSQISRREPSLEIACIGEVEDGPHELSTSPVSSKRLSPRSRLDPIPGSRPVTPMQPLHSSYLRDVQPEDFPLPDSPTLSRATSPVALSSSPPGLPFPPMIGEIAVQSHIHPLFRSESPDPHPSASPNTQIMASPFAGQVVNASQISLPPRVDSRSPPLKMTTDIPNFSRPGKVDVRTRNMI